MGKVTQDYISDQVLWSKMPKTTGIETPLEHYEMLLNGDYKSPLYVVIDCLDTDFKFHPKNFVQMFEMVQKCVAKYGVMREAILVKSPYETGVAELFQSKAEFENYSFEVFSTKESALKWLEG